MLRGRPGWCGKLNNRGERRRIEQEKEAGEKEALKTFSVEALTGVVISSPSQDTRQGRANKRGGAYQRAKN
ncbi:hypothetical protein E2C01_041875 [Portunus trituberculatus]|uniref:Uncharacterized protein n=1 Tax=Portunus trituberculatus TaxID=210409 RepID=A0A5B7FS62_PORTR|nr:hypothetical protein [Portunus trituberculatus]